MCSVGDFDDGEKHIPQYSSINLTNDSKCNKCKDKTPVILLRHKDVYCKDCFLATTIHKFKATIGKHRLIRPDDRVLIDHKIGHPSTALLHFLRTGIDLNTHKKFRFVPIVLFVEDQLHLNREERIKLLNDIQQETEYFKFNVRFIDFREYVLKKGSIKDLVRDDVKDLPLTEESIWTAISKKADKNERNELINIFRRNLLIDAAKQLNCKFVFTPEIAIDTATQLLTDISLGKGANVPIDTGFLDDRDPDVKIFRPLRQFDVKELVFYNYLHNLSPVCTRQKHDAVSLSIQDIMRKFVTDLQVNFPATVTTILKTGEKLEAAKAGNSGICKLCKASIEERTTDLSSAESTNFSRWLSTQTPNFQLSPEERFEQVVQTFSHKVSDEYCYSCAKIADYLLPNESNED